MNIIAKGIDVSSWQKEINWDKVKKAGIQFAILRCGYGSDKASQDDKYFARNLAECERVGIPYGIYLYSYATNVEMAHSEAAHVLRLLGDKKPMYPIYYDLEDAKTTGKCSKALILDMAKAFCADLEAKGYLVGIYANTYWNNTYLTDAWYNTKPRWVAQYASKCTYKGEYGIWQYSSSGKVDGIAGNVDMNYAYADYPTVLTKHYGGVASAPVEVKKTNEQLADEVLKGLWGNGADRKKNLEAAGYDYEAVQSIVNARCATPAKKSNEEIAQEVLDGKWGNGTDRKNRLEAAGYDYDTIQGIVNKKVAKPKLKPIDTIAKEVIQGKWGNGAERVKKLTAAGYNAKAVQDRVNELV